MSTLTLLTWLVLTHLTTSTTTTASPTETSPYPRKVAPRQLERRTAMSLSNGGVHTLPTPSPPVPLTIITMPLGGPVTVWSQRQMVRSYVPILTICPLAGVASSAPIPTPAVATPGIAQSRAGMPDPFPETGDGDGVFPRDELEDCSTSYSSTLTPICATTLSPLAKPAITIDRCEQNVTFSLELGYSLGFATAPGTMGVDGVGGNVTMTAGERRMGADGNGTTIPPPSPTIETLTTYYAAPWSAITSGAVPTGSVETVVCSEGGCTTGTESWEAVNNTDTMVSTATMVLDARPEVEGPANIILPAPYSTTIQVSEPGSMPISMARVVQSTVESVGVGVVKTDPALGGVSATGPTAIASVDGAGEEASTVGGSAAAAESEMVASGMGAERKGTGGGNEGESETAIGTGTGVEITTTIHRTSTRIVTVFTTSSAGGGDVSVGVNG